MEEKPIQFTYRIQNGEYTEANICYHKTFGTLKVKRFFIFSLFSLILATGVIIAASYNNFSSAEDRWIYLAIGGTVAVITSVIMAFLYKRALEKNVVNISSAVYNTSPYIRDLTKTEFFDDFLVITRGYIRIKVKYSAVDCFISDDKYFIFSFGNDKMVRVIPKRYQDPDALFAADNLMREKLGKRFVYRVGGKKA